MNDVAIALEAPEAVDNRLPQPEITRSAARKPALAQVALDRATVQCTAFISLCRRLERVHAAIEAPAIERDNVQAETAESRPRPVAHFEGLAFIADCNDEVLARMGKAIADLEVIFDCST